MVWKDSTKFPGISYLIDVFGTARFEGEQNQLLRFLKKTSIEKLFRYFHLDEVTYF